jgi:alkanesulfonate monooxygenase SsuD/methylene tetrahydromethanopterin reductase-like flavin-dependent oxidoreductase (luciferase family)
METGIFAVPFRLPETNVARGLRWDLQCVQWAEQYGIHEAWFAEHYTMGWENTCAPELLVAAASSLTSRIRLATGANLLPYHNPITLAHALMQLDHMTGGRLICGFGAGGYASDAQLFGQPDLDVRREMMAEGIDTILAIWTRERPFRMEGTYWSVDYPGFDTLLNGPNWWPLQKPHPRCAIAGVSASSGSLRDAGRRGFIPMSFDLANDYLIGHWRAYCEGAAEAGREADRRDWRLFKNVFVADTDEAAMALATSPPVLRVYDQFVLRIYEGFGLLGSFAPGVPEHLITAEYLARNAWIVGSPDTVTDRIEALNEELGGFGVLVTPSFDFLEAPETMRRSLELYGSVVAPRLQAL